MASEARLLVKLEYGAPALPHSQLAGQVPLSPSLPALA